MQLEQKNLILLFCFWWAVVLRIQVRANTERIAFAQLDGKILAVDALTKANARYASSIRRLNAIRKKSELLLSPNEYDCLRQEVERASSVEAVMSSDYAKRRELAFPWLFFGTERLEKIREILQATTAELGFLD